IPIVLGPEFSLIFDLGFGIKIWQSDSAEKVNCPSLGYQLSYGVGFGFSLEPISIPIIPFFLSFQITEEPYRFSFDIISKTPFPFDFASGCWTSDEDTLGTWETGSWSKCSELCGGGEIHRTVRCVDEDNEEVDESQCKSVRPPTTQPCHEFPCNWSEREVVENICMYDTLRINHEGGPWSGIRSRCTWEMYYNDKCDDDCNTVQCAEDNGKCQQEDKEIDACKEFGSDSCESCLQVDKDGAICGWCRSTGQCLPGSYTGPFKSSACTLRDWKPDTCKDPEDPLSFLSPLNGTGSNEFTAGEVLEVTWSGGPVDGQVRLSLSLNGSDTARDGLGLPNDEISASRKSFSWTIPCHLRPDDYFLIVQSTSEATNSAKSEVFQVTQPVDPDYPCKKEEDTYSWTTHPWSPCERECNGTYRIGCFKEPSFDDYFCNDEYDRPLEYLFYDEDSMTPYLCSEEAAKKGYRFAAVQYGQECYGGDSIEEYTIPGDCTIPCSGDAQDTCGGDCTNEIFEVAGVQNREVQCIRNQWSISEEEV
ncbi:hypothetical protein DUNSADRAFT_7273, partial [Dunaliella salina]